MKIGFIGLGEMGLPMALNLLKAGHELTVWNRSPQRAEPLVAQGARLAATAAEVCGKAESGHADAVFVMLADDTALRQVLEAGGVLAALAGPTVLVNLATVSVAYAQALAAEVAGKGAGYVAAPVFGRSDMAAAAQLNIVAAGAAGAIEQVLPLLQAMGKKIWPAGDAPERANVIKIAGNFMLASSIEMMAEATAFTRAHGIAASDFLEVMTQTLFAAPAFINYGKLIAEQRYEPAGFKMQLGLKDVELALTAAGTARVPMPLAALVRDSLLDALAHDGTDKDWAMLAQTAARRAGLV
jgi:3-hydroxyisobutyrate dehydrogenase-like beta-hydroxyacid dehydrogenase